MIAHLLAIDELVCTPWHIFSQLTGGLLAIEDTIASGWHVSIGYGAGILSHRIIQLVTTLGSVSISKLLI